MVLRNTLQELIKVRDERSYLGRVSVASIYRLFSTHILTT